MFPKNQPLRQHLLESLRGQELRIPDLQGFFDHWPQYINPNLQHLRRDVDERLKRLVLVPLLQRAIRLLITRIVTFLMAQGFASSGQLTLLCSVLHGGLMPRLSSCKLPHIFQSG